MVVVELFVLLFIVGNNVEVVFLVVDDNKEVWNWEFEVVDW